MTVSRRSTTRRSLWRRTLYLNRLYLQSQRGFFNADPKATANTAFLDEMDARGDVLPAYSTITDNTLPPEPRRLTTAQACLLPLAPAAWQHFRHGATLPFWAEGTISFGQAVASLDSTGWTALSGFAVILAAVAFVWVRRMVGRATWRALAWAGFVLAFGPAGLLAMRLAGNWPRRVRCPFCGYQRALGEEECLHCQRGWETPTPTGTEIFQPVPARS